MKKLIIVFVSLFLFACGGGDSSSGGGVENSTPGMNLPANFVGVYTGTVTLTASAAGLSETDTFMITITVFANGTVRFDGDEPDETFTVGITDAGAFSGNIEIAEDECEGTLGVVGQVDGTNATGTVEGEGECEVSGLTLDVELTGTFTATK
ncbi:MAG: hypothetical protein AAF431_02635 [Pseudomonadota bacterium]